ncbi:hypothetical protein D3C75_1269580 [compost metagenome]
MPPAGDHLEVIVLLERDAHFAQVPGAYPDVLQYFWIVMGDLAAAHRRPNVVVSNPYFVANLAGPREIDGDHIG